MTATQLLFVLIVTAGGLLAQYLAHKQIRDEREQWAKERSELLTRIQHPNMVMVPDFGPDEVQPIPEEETDDSRLAGKVIGFPSDEVQSNTRIDAFKETLGWNDPDDDK